MSRDASYKPKGSTIVTVPIDPALHKRLRIHAASEGCSIKSAVTQMIENRLAATQTPPTLSEDLREGERPLGPHSVMVEGEDENSFMPVNAVAGNQVYIKQGDAQVTMTLAMWEELLAALAIAQVKAS